jgi:hypothetical protein
MSTSVVMYPIWDFLWVFYCCFYLGFVYLLESMQLYVLPPLGIFSQIHMCFLFVVLELELRPYTLSHSISLFCEGFFELEFHELFPWVGFESLSS